MKRLFLLLSGILLTLFLEQLAFSKDTQANNSNSLKTIAFKWWHLFLDKCLPYWYSCVDWQNGGYILNDLGKEQHIPYEPTKQLVTQARMLWAFSHAHRLGLSSERRDYLEAAMSGYRFIMEKMRDPIYGGYFWKVKTNGEIVLDRKYLYGQAFVIYSLVELFRAGGPVSAINAALELFRTIQNYSHDEKHKGWYEHYTRDWNLITTQDPLIEVEIAGWKSANAHLHWMEALTELYEVTLEPAVLSALKESLEINKCYFYPPSGKDCKYWFTADWQQVQHPRANEISYGHNVEFAWLMIRAEKAIKQPPDWPHFYALIDHALYYGNDFQYGGLAANGIGNDKARDWRKIWWVQAEWIAALTTALEHQVNPDYEAELLKTLRFIDSYIIDPQTGIWWETLTREGTLLNPARAHNWKGAYHDSRAIVIFIRYATDGQLAIFKR